MKKTLIALAVAASAVVSGSAMAAGWEQNGTGGSVDLGGTLTPVTKATPWEVKTGDAVTGLDASIQRGQKVINITVNKAIPVLGIRTQTSQAFPGQAGISPQIDFGSAVNVDAFENGRAPVALEVKDNTNAKIGTLTSSLGASALVSVKGPWSGYNHSYSDTAGQGFFGGLPKNAAATPNENIAVNVMPEVADHYIDQGVKYSSVGVTTTFSNTEATYSGYYGAGIEQGKTIKITLDQAASGDAPIQWKASLPVTVSYQ
ncbi:hypothetical protein RCT70_03675 [Escherichia marmotae]|uniref:F4 family fimbrial subunit n=1 Tax=Escherichia whittamii TaxID=2762229 RepID=UPI0017F316BF|nr:hypothetical protein [Escherichia whittamii]EFE2618866.1 hypothetical protein [Escherichia coli]MEC9522110.1 hypothetical protein [Escherichia marmotae]ELU4644164.1 hypothetical protein [Escherichia coli]MCX1079086.1 hypothetical protein [Escherichia coli]MCX1148544.1 hypothetical protein [Escherichia coli]